MVTTGASLALPRVRAGGAPRERGRQIGGACGAQLQRSIANYEHLFRYYTGRSWGEIRALASAFGGPVEAYDADIAEEMRGIAEGAGVGWEDILALNARTEIMYGLAARTGHECTTFAVLPPRAAAGEALLGMNWDWRAVARESCVMVEIEQPPKPSLITLCEAGLVGKMGFNSAGVGLVGNLLRSDRDRGEATVPVHVVKRGVLDAATATGAVHAVLRANRAASANFMIAHRDGVALNIETMPGGADDAVLAFPDGGVLTHANTFNAAGVVDTHLPNAPDSPCRQDRLRSLLIDGPGPVGVERLEEVLTDHDGFPRSICRHDTPGAPPEETSVTNASIVLDLVREEFHVAFGAPCETPYETFRPQFATRA